MTPERRNTQYKHRNDLQSAEQHAERQNPLGRIRQAGEVARRADGLAQARADIVRSALTAAGVDARRIEALSGGETNPVDSNATAGGLAENRRTELVVVQR